MVSIIELSQSETPGIENHSTKNMGMDMVGFVLTNPANYTRLQEREKQNS